MPNVIIADDHPFSLLGTKSFVESLGYRVIDLCNNGIAALNSIRTARPDIAILDVNMPGMNGIEILEQLQRHRSPARIVLLTMHNEESIFNHARKLGVKGYLLKEFAAAELGKCLEVIQHGECWFSPGLTGMLVMDKGADGPEDRLSALTFSERKVLELIAGQHTTREIAGLLFISEKTVESHRRNIMQKLALPQEKNALLLWAVKNFGAR
jgi:DNA-binding NarL/FixJ family response regulator